LSRYQHSGINVEWTRFKRITWN